ncbi:MAG: hypothetical protein HC896_16225 [Bacteroidales bacterium]|nr:hypothetical protein [Bacteroidales bacterium]
MNKFVWGGIDDPDVYLDENNLRMLANFRNSFGRLAHALIDENKPDSAQQVLDKCVALMPNERVPFYYFMVPVIEGYYKLNRLDTANAHAHTLSTNLKEELTYYFSLPQGFSNAFDYEKGWRFTFISN